MASEELYRLVKEFQARPPRGDTPIQVLRTGFDQFARSRFKLPEGVSFEAVDAGGVPAEWNVPRNVSPQNPVILYMHGGGYGIGSIATHRGLTARLAQAANARALSLDYRLAPENRFRRRWKTQLPRTDGCCVKVSVMSAWYLPGILQAAGSRWPR
jgi:monoterpene epsilon-lactone hydrolase